MSKEDIRWIQRFSNYEKALKQLTAFMTKGKLSPLEEQGLIKAFEYTYELAWNVIKDFYEGQGDSSIQGSKDAFRLAFKRGLIDNGEIWLDMVQSRIQTAHTYNEATAKEVVTVIVERYFSQFLALQTSLEKLK